MGEHQPVALSPQLLNTIPEAWSLLYTPAHGAWARPRGERSIRKKTHERSRERLVFHVGRGSAYSDIIMTEGQRQRWEAICGVSDGRVQTSRKGTSPG